METKFNFKSQIATDKNQSERLLALGLKQETADMWRYKDAYGRRLSPVEEIWDEEAYLEYGTPSWSLGRLIEMMPYCVEMYNKYWCLQISKGYVRYAHNGMEKPYIGYIQKLNTFDAIIKCIEWLIKEGYFPKEYLI